MLDLDAGRVDVDDLGAEPHLDAHLGEAADRAVAELLAERAEHRGSRVEQDDAGLGGVDAPEVALEGAPRQLGDLTGHLDARRAGADDDEGHQPLDLGRGRRELGELERAEDAPAQLERVVDRLHARGVARELVVAEVGLSRAGRDDEGVVGRDALAPDRGVGDGARLEVDVGDLAEQHRGVLLPAQHLTRRGRDLALGEDAGRDLVEQGLEEVVRRAGDEGDIDVGALQPLRAEEAAEAGTDDHHPVSGLRGGRAHVGSLVLVVHGRSCATSSSVVRSSPWSTPAAGGPCPQRPAAPCTCDRLHTSPSVPGASCTARPRTRDDERGGPKGTSPSSGRTGHSGRWVIRGSSGSPTTDARRRRGHHTCRRPARRRGRTRRRRSW